MLTRKSGTKPAGAPVKPDGNVIDASDIYNVYFHGPAYQVIEKAWWGGNRIIALMSDHLPPNHQPSELKTSVAPRVIEFCFQAAGIWELGIDSRMGLPLHIDRLTFPAAITDLRDQRLYAVVVRESERDGFNVEIVDTNGTRHMQLRGYRTISVPDAIDAQKLKPLQDAMSLQPIAA